MKTIKQIHHSMLPLPDGTQLAYRAWLPDDAEDNPVPAILEFLPYRKNDGTVIRDEITMAQTAKQGYACIRVDLRGCGESEGLFDDEYSQQELNDGVDVIAWIADQTWCNGNVGMVGISWGGFNSLQIAALNPPALKSIITICSSDDRYNEDVHYMGGCLLNDNLDWAAFFWAYAQGRAPDKKLVGESWFDTWLARLQDMPFLAKPWLSHQTRDDYWKHGSICENYSDIKIPVYAIGGWADNYRDTVFRLLENLEVPTRGLIGPWAHKYPNIAYPNPKIDYVSESVRWWDRWLKGIENGIDDEPVLNYYLQDSVPAKVDYEHRPGQWISEPSWPSPRTKNKRFYPNSGRLATEHQPEALEQSICSPQSLGLEGGRLCVGIRLDMEQPAEQSPDDAGSLCFDTLPLDEDFAITGKVIANLALSSNTPTANLVVRICDVSPDNQATRISIGVLNLTHRNSHEEVCPLVPDERYNISLPLKNIAYKVPKGHRIRIAISTAYWPLIWPSPDKATITIDASKSYIDVPYRDNIFTEQEPPYYDTPVSYDGSSMRLSDSQRFVKKNYKTGLVTLETHDDFGRQHLNSCDTEIDMKMSQWQNIHPDDPLSAESKLQFELQMGREGWWTSLQGEYHMQCDDKYFYVNCTWKAFRDGEQVFSKEFKENIKRIGV